MYIVSLLTHKSAERHGGGRAYLARLKPGQRGSIDREFMKLQKQTDNRRMLTARAVPGDVFEARRWFWDGIRRQYAGGTVWFGVQETGELCMLTRDEAFAAVQSVGLSGPERDNTPDVLRARRLVPADLHVHPAPTEAATIPLIEAIPEAAEDVTEA